MLTNERLSEFLDHPELFIQWLQRQPPDSDVGYFPTMRDAPPCRWIYEVTGEQVFSCRRGMLTSWTEPVIEREWYQEMWLYMDTHYLHPLTAQEMLHIMEYTMGSVKFLK